jgi:uncharacterized membrane protein
MQRGWDKQLKAWEAAGLIEAGAAARIRAHEASLDSRGDWRWPVALAWLFGGILLCAGVLLFVAANWDSLSPSSRFALVVLLTASFHVGGALMRTREGMLAHVLHVVGTVALGAGIFLAGQIFHLQEHWPGGVMLWAAGAWLAWILLRDRIQGVFCALLTPIWLAGEWMEATANMSDRVHLVSEGLWLLALVFFAARTRDRDGPVRHDLAWIGGLTLIPLTFWVVLARGDWGWRDRMAIPAGLLVFGWIVAYGGPVALGFLLRGRGGWVVIAAAAWIRLFGATVVVRFPQDAPWSWRQISTYVLCAAGSALMAWWGVHEARRERVNLALVAFGLTVLSFYFDNVMDKLGRSISLMILGLLFLAGGYALARMRRRLLAGMVEAAP